VVAITCDFCSDTIPGTTERPRYVKPDAESVGLQRRVETERKGGNCTIISTIKFNIFNFVIIIIKLIKFLLVNKRKSHKITATTMTRRVIECKNMYTTMRNFMSKASTALK
jgi:hypothetical protein